MSLGNEMHNMRRGVLGVSIDTLAELSGINVRRLTPYFSGVRGLPNTEIERLEFLLNDLTRLQTYAVPFLLPKKTADLADLLKRLRHGEFDGKAGLA